MKKKIYISVFLLWFFVVPHTFSAECNFPAPTTTADEIIAKINECKTARKNNTTAQIEDFSCPAGEFSLEDNLPLTDERLAYHIAVNILLNEADKNIKTYFQNLQKSRNKNAVAWSEELRVCIYNTGKKQTGTIESVYKNICNFGTIQNLLNAKQPIFSTTDSQPQTVCEKLIAKKIAAWDTLGKNLTHLGIQKSFENDRNRYWDGLTGQYRSIIEKFHDYQKIIFRASSKVKTYIINAVK